MKVVRTVEGGVVLRLTPNERNLLEGILREYPLIPASHHQLSRTAEAKQVAADQKLLDEAISAQKTEHQRRWQAALRDPGRFRLRGQSFELVLKAGEVEWFLQLLNDIRVGSWLKLGCPGPGEDLPPDPTEADLCHGVAMEFCGVLQSLLLRALHPPG